MYSAGKLKKYPYFERRMRESGLGGILDSLTGVISRSFIMEFVRSLIERGLPFTFAILDLDNFKFINDTYGHRIGDQVLQVVANDLITYLGDDGLVGRFGGDEFLIVCLRKMNYQERKAFFDPMYYGDTVLRKSPTLSDCKPFITGTIGSATYPDDATDFDELFGLIDKTLYRGKSKGRNCYIIYVEEKHRDIEIQKLAGHGLFSSVHDMTQELDSYAELHEKLRAAFSCLKENLRISNLYYVGRDDILRSVCDTALSEPVPDIHSLIAGDLYLTNTITDVLPIAPVFYRVMEDRDIGSLLIVRVRNRGSEYGYLICAEPFNMRIWQEDECATLYFLARELSWFMRETGMTLEQPK